MNDLFEIDIRSREALRALAEERGKRMEIERLAAARFLGDREEFSFEGHCLVCERTTLLKVDWMYAERPTPNWRERLVCDGCELNNRQRYAMHLLIRESGGRGGAGKVYLQEQITPFYESTSRILGAQRVVGSEYLGADRSPGEIVDGLRHEDAEHLSFPDASFQAISSNDVLEHVNEHGAALAQMCRVLVPGGTAIVTIPFSEGRDVTQRRARIEADGSLTHLLPPEYHGNPLDEGGSLVFSDFGWDVLDCARKAGFSQAFVRGYWSFRYGHMGGGLQMLFILRR